MADINGIAHLQLSVTNMARSIDFYRPLMKAMGMVVVIDDPQNYYYWVGARTGLALSPVGPEQANAPFDQRRCGLHHLCFRARNPESVDELYQLAVQQSATVIREPSESGFAPGYYSTLFEDPDGIRIEVNFVPGKGLLK